MIAKDQVTDALLEIVETYENPLGLGEPDMDFCLYCGTRQGGTYRDGIGDCQTCGAEDPLGEHAQDDDGTPNGIGTAKGHEMKKECSRCGLLHEKEGIHECFVTVYQRKTELEIEQKEIKKALHYFNQNLPQQEQEKIDYKKLYDQAQEALFRIAHITDYRW